MHAHSCSDESNAKNLTATVQPLLEVSSAEARQNFADQDNFNIMAAPDEHVKFT
jgi:hypothetical protein